MEKEFKKENLENATKNEIIFIDLGANREEFLALAAKHGLKWLNGSNVKAKDDCSFHVAIDTNGLIANVHTLAYKNFKGKKLSFNEFKDMLESEERHYDK